jgi:hypothetical protein
MIDLDPTLGNADQGMSSGHLDFKRIFSSEFDNAVLVTY